MVHMHWRSCPSRAKSLEKKRLITIAVLCPIPHLRTPQTVSRNSCNFTIALHRQENPQQQSLTQDAASLTHHPVMNVHTQRTGIFYNSPEKKTTYLLVLDQNSVLVNTSETKFLLLKPADFSYAFTEKPVIKVKAFARKTWQRNYIKPKPYGYVCFSSASKHLLCDHERKKVFRRANLGRNDLLDYLGGGYSQTSQQQLLL